MVNFQRPTPNAQRHVSHEDHDEIEAHEDDLKIGLFFANFDPLRAFVVSFGNWELEGGG
jgi:hypothetical protein